MRGRVVARLRGGPYGEQFHQPLAAGTNASAKAILPLLLDLVRPGSVIDVGCGTGSWLAECKRLGVDDVLGVDLGTVGPELLAIEPAEFVARDLSQPLNVDRRFDLAMCMEVAEHLPASAADGLVEQLTALAPVVAFSAAVPHQGGSGHINEQWPEYWAERFEARDFRVVDCLRPEIWSDPDVEFWYAQNLLVFVDERVLAENGRLVDLARATRRQALALVHPRLYLAKAASAPPQVLDRARRVLRRARAGLGRVTVGQP
jgi:SAM-dependent methyltransferase